MAPPKTLKICALHALPESLAQLASLLDEDITFFQPGQCDVLAKQERSALDLILIEIQERDMPIRQLLDKARALAPQAQIMFLGTGMNLRHVRQNLLLLGVLNEQWSFLRHEYPAEWAVILREACEKVARRRSLKQSSPMQAASIFPPLPLSTESNAVNPGFLSSVLEYALEAVLFLDHHGNITFANPAAEKLYGHGRERMMGMAMQKLLAPEAVSAHQHVFEEVVGGANPVLIQLEHVNARGETMLVEQSLAAVKDWRGLVMGVTMMVRDIREQEKRRRLEQERILYEREKDRIEALNQSLEQRVAERTAELLLMNHELESFSYAVSHDLRAPLRAINGFSLALQEDYGDRLDEGAHAYLERMRHASEKMAQLIDALLSLSRVIRRNMQFSPVNLSETVRTILQQLQREDAHRHAVFSVEDGLVVQGDPAMLHLMLYNLLSNAWKFTCQRERTEIHFGACPERGDGVFFVRDNGAGFDMAYANKLFLPFERLHGQDEFAGTGIGLATVQRVIRRHGGQVWAESRPDAGAVFYFSLADHGKDVHEET